MTKKEFKEAFGEDPVDVLGPDWKNELEDLEVAEPELVKSFKNNTKQNDKNTKQRGDNDSAGHQSR
jgi:hypothetical protein